MSGKKPRSGRRYWGYLDKPVAALLIAGAWSTAVASQGDQPAPTTTRSAPPRHGSDDPLFQKPYVDIDEWRDAPVRHRYVHGGFTGTDTRFSFYLPEKARYQRRFFQHITPVPDSENLAPKMPPGEDNKIAFAITSGAYFVETNGGGAKNIGAGDPTITAYRANAAAAQYSRVIAAKMYGAHRPYGYAYGGSGGAFRTIGSIENTDGVWDGVVPYVIGSTMALPNVFTVRIQAMRILWDKFPGIIDALEPGGGGDAYAGLTPVEAAALREVTKMGFPPQSWFGYRTMGVHGFSAIYPIVGAIDRSYFTDFWTKRGYVGHDQPAAVADARISHATTIAAPVTQHDGVALGLVAAEATGGVDNAFLALRNRDDVVGFRLTSAPRVNHFLGGDLVVKSGAAAGKRLQLAKLVGDIVGFGNADAAIIRQIRPGDTVEIDNADFLAAQYYHRHQVPGPDFKVWDQFRNADGTPMYPQRPVLIGPILVNATAGSKETGKFQGKMIVVDSLWDREAYPWQADWYANRVRQNLGARFDDHFRLWYTDHALHGDEPGQEDPTHTVAYTGVLHQALRDLSAWVERGIAPPASTDYAVVDGQVQVPATATQRKGVQPVVTLTANGGARAEVAVGTPVVLEALAQVPPGAGRMVEARWDLGGTGTFPMTGRIVPAGADRVRVRTTYRFAKPGTYFPVVRVVSQRQGDRTTPYARIQNLARARVVVR